MTRLNRKGFISLETFLIVMVLAIIGGAGYFVYQAQNKTKDTLDQAIMTSENTAAGKQAKTSIPNGWVKYDGGNFSFYYPSSWAKNFCEGAVLLGPTNNSAGKCNSDAFPEVGIFWFTAQNGSVLHYNADDLDDFKQENVKIAGATGYKESGTWNPQEEIMLGPQKGSKQIQYVLGYKGQTVHFNYIQDPSFKDVSDDFETMVNNTLKFN